MSNIPQPHKYAYFVVNDSDDLEALQECLISYGGVEAMYDVVVDYAPDKRRIVELIRACGERSIIYTPYLARLGKSLKELYGIVQFANEKNIDIVFCDKPNVTFNPNNTNGQINFAALKWAMELDCDIRSEYNKASTAKRKDEIERIGYFTTNNGEVRKSWGNKKGYDMSAARLASSKSKVEAAEKWKENSKAVKLVLRKSAEGWGVTQIADELGKLYDDAPDIYCTSKGCKPTKGTVSKWLKEAKEKQSSSGNK